MAKHIPRHRFGQHFLEDESVLQRIVQAIHPKPNQNLLEIGPGLGALTVRILPLCQQLTAVELDRDLISPLKKKCESFGQLTVYQQDILTFILSSAPKPGQGLWRLFGNLPYNISTPLFFHLLTQCQDISDMTFMVQKEVADRATAKVNESAYGRLSVMLQYACEAEKLFDVPASAFRPPPQVESSVIILKPRSRLLRAQDENLFSKLVLSAFQMRRKTIRNSLRLWISDWSAVPLDSTQRAENLSIEDYIQLSNYIAALREEKG